MERVEKPFQDCTLLTMNFSIGPLYLPRLIHLKNLCVSQIVHPNKDKIMRSPMRLRLHGYPQKILPKLLCVHNELLGQALVFT